MHRLISMWASAALVFTISGLSAAQPQPATPSDNHKTPEGPGDEATTSDAAEDEAATSDAAEDEATTSDATSEAAEDDEARKTWATAGEDAAAQSAHDPAEATEPEPDAEDPPPVAVADNDLPNNAAELDVHPDRPTLDNLGSHQSHWWIDVGVRTSYINDSGMDPFAYDDALVQFSGGLGRVVFAARAISVGVGLQYEGGGNSADARGDSTTLMVHRLMFAPELRNHLLPRMYVFVQPAVGALRTHAMLDDGASGATLESKSWSVGFDLTAGTAFQVYGAPSGDQASPRLWISAEGGYGWMDRVHLEMSPDDDSDGPQRIAAVDMGELALNGPTFRLSATLSY